MNLAVKSMKKAVLLFILLVASLFAMTSNVNAQYAGNCNPEASKNSCIHSSGEELPGFTCSCNQTAFDNCRDKGEQCKETDCKCVKTPDDQEPCYHTICPVNYSCTGTGDKSYCYYNPGRNDVCPVECRQGSACGVGYSPASGCSGSGVGGGCKTTQVCCTANYCGNSDENTNYCIREEKVTECKQAGNCNGGDQDRSKPCGYEGGNKKKPKYNCTYIRKTNICTPSPAPTIGGQCLAVKVYLPNWTEITQKEYFELLDNSNVNFCVRGMTNTTTGNDNNENNIDKVCGGVTGKTCSNGLVCWYNGSLKAPSPDATGICELPELKSNSTTTNTGDFDKARFTINGQLYPETIVQRPNSTDFCQIYTIPTGSYTTKVQGEIHHPVLGWL